MTPQEKPKERREERITLVVQSERRLPAWLRRMQEQGLPDKDLTGQIKVA